MKSSKFPLPDKYAKFDRDKLTKSEAAITDSSLMVDMSNSTCNTAAHEESVL